MLKKRAVLSVVIALCLFTSGCAAIVAAGAAGGAGVAWYQGWLTDQLSTPVPQTVEAIKSGLKDLELPVHETHYTHLKGSVNSELIDKTKVRIKLKATEGGTTEIKIRVGTLGDKDASHKILNAIKKHI